MCFYDVVCALVKCVVSTVKQCCTIKIDLYFTRNKHGSSECRIWIDFSNNRLIIDFSVCDESRGFPACYAQYETIKWKDNGFV